MVNPCDLYPITPGPVSGSKTRRISTSIVGKITGGKISESVNLLHSNTSIIVSTIRRVIKKTLDLLRSLYSYFSMKKQRRTKEKIVGFKMLLQKKPQK